MKNYAPPISKNWKGRTSEDQQYIHEKIECVNLFSNPKKILSKGFGIIGYACDEGVKRNKGRVGAIHGPDRIKQTLGPMPNPLANSTSLYDFGNISCLDNNLEITQENLATSIAKILHDNCFPIGIGGGHDIAYGHYNGIKKHLGNNKSIGIINFDAHFDLRSDENRPNSGTPFYQIAKDCLAENLPFNYLCLGIREDANPKILFETAKEFNVDFIYNNDFNLQNIEAINNILDSFINKVDAIYVTIDLDGFSSAYAPGVSAASPMGFAPDIVLISLHKIIASKKLISLDLAEFNPKYDRDNQTAKLASSLIHFVLRKHKHLNINI
ncbi:formiminoglutamase [Maribacter vaceletii]|uniref:Formimidoylglutamase n=1 Tax=Maribacter vaceletii TaxID=1206816 RepID=A0A495EBI7_9FLAO|nr:formimidoylglutamase [Maribacter vaceletii]RKR14220.1 formiminoglutamase [Maribacter vaceletii]